MGHVHADPVVLCHTCRGTFSDPDDHVRHVAVRVEDGPHVPEVFDFWLKQMDSRYGGVR